MNRHTRPPRLPYATLFRSERQQNYATEAPEHRSDGPRGLSDSSSSFFTRVKKLLEESLSPRGPSLLCSDRKSTRLNSSHPSISYAVFCLKKKRIKDKKNSI